MLARFPKWRLRLILAGMILALCVIIYRITFIQIIDHRKYEQLAKLQSIERVDLPAKRGKILDRNGHPLAVTYRVYTLGLTPRDFPSKTEIIGEVAAAAGVSAATINRYLKMDREYIQIKRNLHLTGREVERLSAVPGVRLDPGNKRLKPLEAINSEFIGAVNHKDEAVNGVEAAFDDLLKGEDGWVVFSRDAKNRCFRPLGAPCRKAANGDDLFLAIDSNIQVIASFELKKAVDRYGAKGGVVIVADPTNGDILALSEYFPESGRHTLYSTSCYYEPGSTFKLVTDSYLLESGKVDPYDAYYGEEGEAEFDFGRFRDDHPHGWMTFRESFVYSSNICTIKAVLGSDPVDFHRYILRLGFGNRTGVDFPAESEGLLRDSDQWSGRSLASVAIGQEIGVTPLQMLYSYCAVANGGELYVPRLAVKVMDEKNEVKNIEPVRVRRVFSQDVSRRLKEFCRDVVVKGTGGEASTDLVPVAGKTGTAQKADGTGYQPGKYISSFIGFAPVESPRIACLVMLDEPDYPYHYGGLSSAPVFKKVIEGICLTTDYLSGKPDDFIAVKEDGWNLVRTPCFYRLGAAGAFQMASRAGFRVSCQGKEGVVFSQIPGPGTLVEPGTEIKLRFRKELRRERKTRVPDLKGLTIRHARRKLIECGFQGIIRGSGVVKKQFPDPGAFMSEGSNVSLYCEIGLKL